MAYRMNLRITFALLAVVLALARVAVNPATAQPDELADLNRRVIELLGADKYKEVLPLAERAAELAQASADKSLSAHAAALHNLARAHHGLSHFEEAEPRYNRALNIRAAVLGEAHPDTAESRNWLAMCYRDQSRHAEAVVLLNQALAIYEQAPAADHRDAISRHRIFRQHAFTLDILTGLYRRYLRLYPQAEQFAKQALALRIEELGPKHPETTKNRGTLALLYRDQGRFSEAEQSLKDALAAYEEVPPPDNRDVVAALDYLTGLYRLQGCYQKAEPHLKHALVIQEKTRPGHPDLARSLTNLALLYRDQHRFGETEPLPTLDIESLLKRAIDIWERALGRDHLALVQPLDTLAGLYRNLRRPGEAALQSERALAIREKRLGRENPETAESMSYLALAYRDLGRYSEAEHLLQTAIAVREKALGLKNPSVAETIDHLADLYRRQGRHREAEPLLQRALAIRKEALGADHPDTAESFHNLAGLYFDLEDWQQALANYERSIDILVRRKAGGVPSPRVAARCQGPAELARGRERFASYVRAAYRVSAQFPDRKAELGARGYETAQWALFTDAAGALAQMSARFGSGSHALARLVREYQDLADEWRITDGRLVASLSKPAEQREDAAKSKAAAEQTLRSRLNAIEARLDDIGRNLQQEFPEYAALANPKPLSVGDTQKLLRPDEALFQVMFSHDEGFAWVLTNREVRWLRIDVGIKALGDQVAALRCGLDFLGAWTGARCFDLLGVGFTEADHAGGKPLPFDHGRAHDLYKALFGRAEDLIENKHLLIVPSGPLTQLPFQVLVAETPDLVLTGSEALRKAKWLARRHAVTILPAVSSLAALRRHTKASSAAKPLIGFGNPLLDGEPAKRPWEAKIANLAREKQRCPKTTVRQLEAGLVGYRSAASVRQHGEPTDVAHIRAQTPLPETADELCAVAKELGAAEDDIQLGSRATEKNVKALSSSGVLAQYRIAHFATHGALAGEIGDAEPGLVLTPPDKATPDDDGYLSASEIAELNLDADWVVLSACNTAAGGARDADALSGLARAFFYAGTRALLVSHWYVNSAATVTLITKAVRELSADARVGRAEALRRSMLALIDQGEPREAHPSYWAPFVVVGEGSR